MSDASRPPGRGHGTADKRGAAATGARHSAGERGVQSTAAVAGHPIHPMLVPLPIGLLVSALGADLGYWFTGDPFWARGSLWLVGVGVLSGLAAAAAGLIDFLTIAKVREHRAAWIHLLGNAAALSLAAISWLIRLPDPADAVLPAGILLSAIVVAILGVTGWYGGELAYRHRIGVIDEP